MLVDSHLTVIPCGQYKGAKNNLILQIFFARIYKEKCKVLKMKGKNLLLFAVKNKDAYIYTSK